MPPPAILEERNQSSHRAKVRIGVAVALLVTAIVILTVLNQRRGGDTKEETDNAPAAAQASLSSAEMESVAAAVPEEPPTITPPPAEPVATPEPPPPPVTGSLPTAQAATASKPAAGPVLEEESSGATAAAPYTPRASQSLGQPGMSVAAVQSPARPPNLTPTPSTATPPAAAAAPKGFEVQLGVFTDFNNARDLQTKLAQHGIPSHTETRVQIGPFKSRAEADQAREKLKTLGISAVVLGK